VRYITHMPLTNAERQALFRDRRRTMMTDLMVQTRKDIREWSRLVALYESGQSKFYTNHVDTTPEQIASLQRMIRENKALLEQYDPTGGTHDGEIELGDVAPAAPQALWRGRPVTYALDDEGRATAIWAFDAESAARTDARARGLHAGVIGDQSWSIRSFASDRGR